jgi:hypothetical protein
MTGWIFPALALATAGVAAAAAPPVGDLLVEAFGERVRHDPEKVRTALAAPAGTRLEFDEDGDGGIDTYYFVDRDARHTGEYLPMVVKAIAPAGNFKGNQLSWTHALFIADWKGDGTADRLVGHLDDDGDGDIDRMLVASPWHDYFGPLHLVLAQDVGDDNRLWYHRNYWTDTETYWWRSDFNGDEVFHFFTFNPATKKWDQKGEGPFAFFDNDHDGFADEIVRRDTSIGDYLTSVRWSFDLDRDANEFQVHDYDLSLSGYGKVEIPANLAARTRIGTAETGPFIPWDQARPWVRAAPWKALMLTADEMDNNVDLQEHGELHERWEGVLNDSSEAFPQVGGPSAGPFNRRAEVDHDNSGHGVLYYSPVDRRLHLFGAESGAQKIDFNLDGRVDMTIRTGDRSGDGYLDVWEVDVDADGVNDLTYGYLQRLGNDLRVPFREISQETDELAKLVVADRQLAVAENCALIKVLRAILQATEKEFHEDAAEKFFRDELVNWRADAGGGAKMRASIETERFYTDIIRHRYFARLMQLKLPKLNHLPRLYWAGGPAELITELKRQFPDIPVPTADAPATTITVTNTSALKLWRQPVVVDLRAAFPDGKIAVDGVSVWDPRRHLHPLPLLAQSDDLDGDGTADELVFAVDLAPGESVTLPLRMEVPSIFLPRVTGQGGKLVSPAAEFSFAADGTLRFTGKDHHGTGTKSAPLDVLRIPAMAERKLEVVRDGPLRAILRVAGKPLIVIAQADRALLELRWSGAEPLAVEPRGPAQPLAAEVVSVSGFNVLETFDGDYASAIFGAPESSTGNAKLLTTTGTLIVHPWWRGGDQAPLWPARSNWSATVNRVATSLTAIRITR